MKVVFVWGKGIQMGCRGVPEGHRWYYGFGFSGEGRDRGVPR